MKSKLIHPNETSELNTNNKLNPDNKLNTNDKLDPDMVGYLLFYSSKQNRDELKKRIDDMKLRAKEQDEI